MKKELLFLFTCLIFLFSCKNDKDGLNSDKELATIGVSENAETLEPQEYVAWVQNPENGLKRNKEMNDITFSVQYKPLEYIVCIEERKPEIEDSIVKQKVNELSDMQYFDLRISLNEGAGELLKYKLTSQQQYSQRVDYFAFGMQKDIILVEGKDTIPCALYHFERAYDVTPTSTFLLGFNLSKKVSSENKTLIIYDRTFNKGMIKIAFDKNELEKLPKLKTV